MHAVLIRRSRRAGHNLLEVIVATMIFLTALVFMTGIWQTHHQVLTRSRNRLVASSLARAALEQRIAGGYDALTPIVDTPQVQSFTSRSQVRGRFIEVPFKTTFLVTQSPSSIYFRRLIATVEWEEDGGPKSLSYETCLFRTN